MGRPLAEPPPPESYRQFLSARLRELATTRYPVAEDFRTALRKAGFDVKLTTIYEWYRARRLPDVERLRTVADVLGVATDDLLPPCPRRLRETIGVVGRRI